MPAFIGASIPQLALARPAAENAPAPVMMQPDIVADRALANLARNRLAVLIAALEPAISASRNVLEAAAIGIVEVRPGRDPVLVDRLVVGKLAIALGTVHVTDNNS